jgi:23S rRNA pseudouridine1911/1915/1917 synthase
MTTSETCQYVFVVGQENIGKRLDTFLAEQEGMISRSNVQKLIKTGYVKVNGMEVKPSYQMREGDTVVTDIPVTPVFQSSPEEISIDIVYEDDDIIIVNKKRGMVVHPAPGNYTGTLVNALLHHSIQLSETGGMYRPGIVHRLDKDTSGLLIVAKNDIAHVKIAAQLKARTITREYVAIVCGRLREDSGTIEAPIGRHPVHRKKMAVLPSGRLAVTHYKVLQYLPGFTYVSARLGTGRTHQIRVHMAYIGHPVLGDEKYCGVVKQFPFVGHALHARRLAFTHPRTGEVVEFVSEVPEDMIKILKRLRGHRVF